MQTYLVGGAVRDKLLGLPIKDRDWVVVGATPEQMQALGFRPVGKDFPVFLHPETQEEYALARTERKQGRGYKGFALCADPSVTLEEDLERRDLTINALAEDEAGRIIDPYGGQADLEQRLLKPVSAAFGEDPLRVLRTARFAARFADLGFQVAEQTRHLMQKLVMAGEMAFLTPERVWLEMQKALYTPQPGVFFAVLEQAGALEALWPEFAGFWRVHPELPERLQQAAHKGLQPAELLAVMLVDVPEKDLQAFLAQLKLPKSVVQQVESLHGAKEHSGLQADDPQAVLALLEKLDAWRRPELAINTLKLLEFLGLTQQQGLLQTLLESCRNLKAADLVAQGLKGPQVGEALREKRLQLLEKELAQHHQAH
ncbi:polynucleotide adenylyltransferase [Marinospirillum sp.]|uniref:polynucleotide adenylyltransferase n=1 Tax=Marinospirillum sp. TaxID=2183934 RepID=UPI00384F30F2